MLTLVTFSLFFNTLQAVLSKAKHVSKPYMVQDTRYVLARKKLTTADIWHTLLWTSNMEIKKAQLEKMASPPLK